MELTHKGVGVSTIICGETRGTALHQNRQSNANWEGYPVQKKAFDVGAKWMGDSFLGATFERLNTDIAHAVRASRPRRVYWSPIQIKMLAYFPYALTETMMMSPPPDFLLSDD